MTYGFIGTGNMGGALARALVKTVPPADIFLNNRTMARAEALAAELQGQKQAAAAERMLILETKYGLKTYPLDALIHLYLAEGEHKTDILEHLKEEAL